MKISGHKGSFQWNMGLTISDVDDIPAVGTSLSQLAWATLPPLLMSTLTGLALSAGRVASRNMCWYNVESRLLDRKTWGSLGFHTMPEIIAQ